MSNSMTRGTLAIAEFLVLILYHPRKAHDCNL